MPRVLRDSLEKKLRRLVETGSIPLSALGKRHEEALRPLVEAQVLVRERAGAGLRYKVTNIEAVIAFARARFPHWDKGLHGLNCLETTIPHAAAIRYRKDSKAVTRAASDVVLLRGFKGTHLVSLSTGERFDVSFLTEKAGLSALLIKRPFEWAFHGRNVWIVENLEAFLHIEKVEQDVELALYGSGRLSTRVISWLASPLFCVKSFIHFPDYDPAGLAEYLRLKENLKERAVLYIPLNLESMLKEFGKKSLMLNQAHLIRKLRECGVEEIAGVLELLEKHGRGLEQEVLLSLDI